MECSSKSPGTPRPCLGPLGVCPPGSSEAGGLFKARAQETLCTSPSRDSLHGLWASPCGRPPRVLDTLLRVRCLLGTLRRVFTLERGLPAVCEPHSQDPHLLCVCDPRLPSLWETSSGQWGGEWRLFLECHVLHSALHRLWTRGPEAMVSQGLPLLRVRGPERTGSHAPLALCPCPAPLPGPGPCPSPLQLTKETALSPTNCPSSPQTLASFSPPPGHVSPSAPHVLSSGSHWGPLSRTLHFSPGKAEGTCLGPCLAQSGHRQPTPWDEHTQARLPVQLAAMEGNFGRFLGRKWCHPVPEMLSPNEETAIPHLRGWPANH